MRDADIETACADFDPRGLREGMSQACDTHVAFMHPRDFLRLASPVPDRVDGAGRTAVVQGLLDAGTPFSSFPALVLQVEDDRAWVEAHDGRHRAMALLERGRGLIPVVLSVETGDGDDARAAVEGVRVLFPQPHEEDDVYPGWDEEALQERLEPLPAADVLASLVPLGEIRGALDRRGPAAARRP